MSTPDGSGGLDRQVLERYQSLLSEPTLGILDIKTLGQPVDEIVKRYGCGTSLDVDYRADGEQPREVFQTVRPGPHGHETMQDRAQLLLSNGVPVVFDSTASIRPYRDQVRSSIDRHMEVYVDCPLEECVRRDPKGIYRDGLRGNSDNIPGLQSEYESPLDPEVVVSGREDSVGDAVDQVISALTDRGFIGAVDSK
jgi:hypothetical protein